MGSKISADGDCSHEIKRHILLGRKLMSNLDSIFKSRERHYFANKGLSSQGYGFPSCHVWMWELDCEESWALKNWCFWSRCWRRLLRVPLTARRSNQSILKEISPGISLEGMMLKLKLQYFGHLMWRVGSLEKTLVAGRDWGQEEKGTTEDEMAGWHHWLDVREFEWTPSWWWTGRPGVLRFMGSQIVGHDWATELNWTFMDPSLLASVILSCFLCRSCDLTPYEVSSVIEFFWPLYFPVTGICYQ